MPGGLAGLLLCGCDGVPFATLGYAELDDSLGLDLDGLAGIWGLRPRRVTLALCLDELADAGDGELAVLLGLFDCGVCEQFEAGLLPACW